MFRNVSFSRNILLESLSFCYLYTVSYLAASLIALRNCVNRKTNRETVVFDHPLCRWMSVIARRLLLAVSENRIGGIVGAMEREGNEKSRAPMKVRGYRLQAVPVSLFPTRQSHGERISIAYSCPFYLQPNPMHTGSRVWRLLSKESRENCCTVS